ncbi:MAG TPA: TolC family protein [Verrucomicrobiales bacterium]|nr:TolC family protein [Verrucomicrobiales bacterium]
MAFLPRSRWWLPVLFTSGVACLGGEPGPSPGSSPDLEGLIRLAWENSPDLKAAETEAMVARATHMAARDRRDPALRIQSDWDDAYHSRAMQNENVTVALRFYPNNPWEVRARLEKALAEITLADFLVDAVRREIAIEVRRRYRQLQLAAAVHQQTAEMVQLGRDEIARLQTLVGQNLATRDDLDDVRRRVLRDAPDLIQARQADHQARAALAALAGIEDPALVEARRGRVLPDLRFETSFVPVLENTALLMRRDLGELIREQIVARGELKEVRSQRILWLESFDIRGGSSAVKGILEETSYGFRMDIRLPLFSALNKEEEISKAQIAGIEEQVRLLERRIRLEVRNAAREARRAGEDYRAFDSELLEALGDLRSPLAGEAPEPGYDLRRAAKEYDIGRFEVEEAYLDALYELEKAMGAPLNTAFRTEAK